MLCFQGSRMAKSKIQRARGVPVLPEQGDVRQCSLKERLQRLHSCCRSSGQHGQGLMEYALVFALIGVALSLLWQSITSLGGTEFLLAVVRATYSGYGIGSWTVGA